MQIVRQLASGLVYAFVSILLVIGSLSLSLAQQSTIPQTSAIRTPLPSTPTEGRVTVPAASATATAAPSMTATRVTATLHFPTVYHPPTATAKKTCGPYAGWIKAYVVQPGDTLFRIASRYGTTAARLENANCRTSTLIFAGERLWVPNVTTVTPGVTLIPTFDTPTDRPTEPATPSTPSMTSTIPPSETSTLDP